MRRRLDKLVLFLTLWSSLSFAVAGNPLGSAADYYFEKGDYKQALHLLTRAVKKHPLELHSRLRVIELKFMLEGRQSARNYLSQFIADYGEQLSSDSRSQLIRHFQHVQRLFVSDEGQSKYLQASVKWNHQDYKGAAALVVQGLSLEPGHPDLLRLQALCDFEQKDYAAYLQHIEQAYEFDPFDSKLRRRAAEAYMNFRQYSNVERILGGVKISPPENLMLAVALVELKRLDDAKVLVRQYLVDSKTEGPNPVVYYILGVLQQAAESTLAGQYFRTYLKSSKTTEADSQWDPFHHNELVDHASLYLKATS